MCILSWDSNDFFYLQTDFLSIFNFEIFVPTQQKKCLELMWNCNSGTTKWRQPFLTPHSNINLAVGQRCMSISFNNVTYFHERAVNNFARALIIQGAVKCLKVSVTCVHGEDGSPPFIPASLTFGNQLIPDL